MENNKDKYFADESKFFNISLISVVGDRDEQQDSIGYLMHNNSCFVAICDGMGGHQGGKKASKLAIDHIMTSIECQSDIRRPDELLLKEMISIDKEIYLLTDENNVRLEAGTTFVGAWVFDKFLYWMSVGDSRLYLYRSGELVQVTQDQIYKTVLDEQLSTGEINKEEYSCEIYRGESLISYLGFGNIQLFDNNTNPFILKQGDKLLLMSDGLYKLVSDDEIKTTLDNFNDISEVLYALNSKAAKNAKKCQISRDNMTVAIVTLK